MATVYDFEAQTIDGQTVALSAYQGKVLLIVNTASACGFTPQFAGLEKTAPRLADQGLWCWAFPATSLAAKTQAAMKKSALFAKKIMACLFP
jgi:glutathione peroxidase